MPKTLNLAQQLKEQISQESETIQSLTKKQLEDMRLELSATYQQELNTIKADIKRQNQSITLKIVSSRFLWMFLTGLSLSMGLFIGSWGIIEYSTTKIADNYLEIQDQNKKMEKLISNNIETLRGDKKNYLIFPKNSKIIDTYTSEDGAPVVRWE